MSYMILNRGSNTMWCGPNLATTCTFHLEMDAPWGKIPMPTLTLIQPHSLTTNRPTDWRS